MRAGGLTPLRGPDFGARDHTSLLGGSTMGKKEKRGGDHRRHIAGGHIKVARRLKESAIWLQDPHYLRLWTYLLLSVRWDEKPIQKGSITIGRGQVLKSFRRIADDNEWRENRALKKWSTSRVKRMLDWLSENEMVSLQGTEVGTLITVLNFNDYQDPETYRLEPGTQSERSRNAVGTIERRGRRGKKRILHIRPTSGAYGPSTVGGRKQTLSMSGGRWCLTASAKRTSNAT